jgi:hypothetical protein
MGLSHEDGRALEGWVCANKGRLTVRLLLTIYSTFQTYGLGTVIEYARVGGMTEGMGDSAHPAVSGAAAEPPTGLRIGSGSNSPLCNATIREALHGLGGMPAMGRAGGAAQAMAGTLDAYCDGRISWTDALNALCGSMRAFGPQIIAAAPPQARLPLTALGFACGAGSVLTSGNSTSGPLGLPTGGGSTPSSGGVGAGSQPSALPANVPEAASNFLNGLTGSSGGANPLRDVSSQLAGLGQGFAPSFRTSASAMSLGVDLFSRLMEDLDIEDLLSSVSDLGGEDALDSVIPGGADALGAALLGTAFYHCRTVGDLLGVMGFEEPGEGETDDEGSPLLDLWEEDLEPGVINGVVAMAADVVARATGGA